jgi:D-beta-D-heptose 7-phosphate kinase/D-beta-D-heptose 1-phosphate adenosyltransferase
MTLRNYKNKIVNLEQMLIERELLRANKQKLVFTNGCFDILHAGHIDYLNFSRLQGDALVVGMNSDTSIQENKGPLRPFVPQAERALVLAALEMVDYVIIFDTDEPKPIIEKIIPDVLVKGEDWAHYVSGREVVEANGGKVVLAPLVAGLSTTNIAEKIKQAADNESR